MGAVLAAICGSAGSTSGFVASGLGSARCATLCAGRNADVKSVGVEFRGGATISDCVVSGRGVEARVTCVFASNKLKVSVVTRNTATIVAPSTTFVRLGAAATNCGLRLGRAAVASPANPDGDPRRGVCANERVRPLPAAAS
jgi:hypothetical protein